MPTYVYGLDAESGAEGCEKCRGHFEADQRMSEEPLKVCPDCGAAVVRIIQPPNLGNIGGKLKGPSSETMKKAGFTQYKRAGKGQYEKSFGSGPSTLGG